MPRVTVSYSLSEELPGRVAALARRDGRSASVEAEMLLRAAMPDAEAHPLPEPARVAVERVERPYVPAPGSRGAEILEALAEGQKSIEELRAAMPGAHAASIRAAAAALEKRGLIVRVAHGVYRLA